jgi:hypothetical protein
MGWPVSATRQVFICQACHARPCKHSVLFTEDVRAAFWPQITFRLGHECLRVVSRILLDKEPGTRRADNIDGAQATMEGLADAFARLSRMPYTHDDAAVRSRECAQTIEQGPCLVGPVHVDIAKKALDRVKDHKARVKPLQFSL